MATGVRDDALSSEDIILFDVPTKAPRQSSSQNVFKTRALLAFKGLPYQTTWLEYPQIADSLKSFGIEKNAPGTAYTDYWLPAVRMPDGTYIMDSYNIALAIEAKHPDPPLFVAAKGTTDAQNIMDKLLRTLAPAYLYRLPDDHLSTTSKEWYHEQRGRLFGTTDLHQVAKMPPFSGDTPWQNAKSLFQELNTLLSSNIAGPFILGDQVSYADFIIGGYWIFLHQVDHEGDVYKRVMDMHPSFAQHEQASREWFARAD